MIDTSDLILSDFFNLKIDFFKNFKKYLSYINFNSYKIFSMDDFKHENIIKYIYKNS